MAVSKEAADVWCGEINELEVRKPVTHEDVSVTALETLQDSKDINKGWGEYTNMDLQEVHWGGIDWIDLAQNRDG
jgi:hypothetical protein